MGGPPTTKAVPGKRSPAPPDPSLILTVVDSDLSQLGAIKEYAVAKAAVAAGEQGVVTAGAFVQSAEATLSETARVQHAAEVEVGHATDRMKALALAAYTGIGYNSPPSAGQSSIQSGSTSLGGLSSDEAVDAQVMLQLVARHVLSDMTATRRLLSTREQETKTAAAGVTQAQQGVATAQASLAADQRNLALVVRAATVPGVAATGATRPASLASGATTIAGTSPYVPAAAALGPSAAGPLSGASAAGSGPPGSPLILGTPILDGAELAAWFTSTSHKANTTVPITQLAADYAAAGKATGVRDDIAFAQSVIETGYFSFPSFGQLTPKYNNFAGIGACDSCTHGWSFPSAKTGVAAQMELLEAYASPKPVSTPLIGNVGVGGCCSTWIALAGKWASSLQYGISIMTVYQQMLAWVIPQRLVQAGLLAKKAPPARGPSLAPLPGAAGT